ncbi:hypothetical protein ACJ41O_008904 [Fusarium nematophilum]
MSSVSFTEVTTEIRFDHTHWRCTNWTEGFGGIFARCGCINPMTSRSCQACGETRDVGAKALDSEFMEIGELMIRDSDGTEYWYYLPRRVNGVNGIH